MPAIRTKPRLVYPSLSNLIGKICILLFVIAGSIPVFSQKKANIKIENNETEVTAFVMGEGDLTYGIQFVYRLSLLKQFKAGAGILYGADNENTYASIYGYGAIFADVLQFLGAREKWAVGGQVGKGIYNRDIGIDKIQGGVYYSISGNYRAIVSKRLLLTTSIFFGHRNFHYKKTGYSTGIYHIVLTGLKVGIVF